MKSKCQWSERGLKFANTNNKLLGWVPLEAKVKISHFVKTSISLDNKNMSSVIFFNSLFILGFELIAPSACFKTKQ